jgi:hypothetical protein
MSLRSHALVRVLSLIGFGNFPSRIPAHHVDLLTGIIRNTSGKRKKKIISAMVGLKKNFFCGPVRDIPMGGG